MKTQVYLVPGLGANCKIFKHIHLPEDQYDVQCLEWITPISMKESISDYARRMAEQITGEKIILIGVSFGGIVAQEIAKIIPTEKTVIIASVKSRKELPLRIRMGKYLKIHRLLPYSKINQIEKWILKIYGDKVKRKVDKYKDYLSVRNPLFLKWAMDQVPKWDQKEPIPNVLHIHSDQDEIFPIKYIQECIVVKNTPHILMIMKRARAINKILANNLTTS